MTKMSKRAMKTAAGSVAENKTEVGMIDLDERIPEHHPERAGERRYALTRNGAGRIDMMTYRDVPQDLVDAALAAAEAKAMAAQSAIATRAESANQAAA